MTILICVKAGFVFAIAGQLTISDNSASQGISENLNPDFVSFIGIISGLLSEHATARIRKAGLAFFKGEEERRDQVERWAVGLGTEMIKQNKTVADLLPFVNVPEEIVKEWIDERRSIPPDMQGIIAAWIDVPIRQLFTDLQPAHTEEERNQVPID